MSKMEMAWRQELEDLLEASRGYSSSEVTRFRRANRIKILRQMLKNREDKRAAKEAADAAHK